MGLLSEHDLERASGDENGGNSDDVELRQFIREEIRTAVQNEMDTSSAPPSYDPSAPLLTAENAVAMLNDAVRVEPPPVNKNKMTGWRLALFLFLGFSPVVAVFGSMPFLTITHIDEFTVCIAAFCLVLTMYVMIVVVAALMALFAFAFRKIDDPTAALMNTPPQPQPEDEGGQIIGPLAIAWHFAFCYFGFMALMFFWITGRPDSLLVQYRNAEAFNNKLGMWGGLGKLITCLDKIEGIRKVIDGEGRKASVADLVSCLVDIGVNPTGFIKGVDN